MIFAVGKEINVVTFKTKIIILIIKLLRTRAGIHMLFPLVVWKKVLFLGKKAGKRVFFIKKRLEFHICHRWTPCRERTTDDG